MRPSRRIFLAALALLLVATTFGAQVSVPAQLIVTRDGRLQAGPLDWSGSVTASDGRTVPVGGVNVDPHPGDVVLYTPAWGGDTPDGADTELVVRGGGAVGAIGAT